MNIKTATFLLLVTVLSLGPVRYDVLASDEEAVVTETVDTGSDNTEVTENESNENSDEILLDIDSILNAMSVNQQKMDLIHSDLLNVSALLLILVVFETLRIVRSWSKGIGVK